MNQLTEIFVETAISIKNVHLILSKLQLQKDQLASKKKN